jgi:hypothetical protein
VGIVDGSTVSLGSTGDGDDDDGDSDDVSVVVVSDDGEDSVVGWVLLTDMLCCDDDAVDCI